MSTYAKVSWRVIHGYMLSLTRANRARFYRGKLVAVESS